MPSLQGEANIFWSHRQHGWCSDPEKTRVFQDWQRPQTERDVSGQASYYRRLFPNFANIAVPLHALTGCKKAKGKVKQIYYLYVNFLWNEVHVWYNNNVRARKVQVTYTV